MNSSRRTLLKGIGCGVAALASSSASASIFSADKTDTFTNQSLHFISPERTIKVYLQQANARERLSLVNRSGKPVMLDAKKPIHIERVNGSLVVKFNRVTNSALAIQSGGLLSFDVDTSTHANSLLSHARMKSAHPTFNGRIPAIMA